ncbi:MAG TPA: hypothetical protein VFI84_00670, partial [Candidatus Saccharimonadales bacterium]|nr:hypothetical protein [Candidatus Saccharimonadales bacterium]
PSTGTDGINATAVDTTNGYIYSVGYDNSPGHSEWRIDKQSTTSGSSASGFPITENLSSTDAKATAVALDVTNGYFYVVGYSNGAFGDGWQIEKRSMSTGAEATNFPVTDDPSTGSDRPTSVAVDGSAGFVYVVGFDNSPGSSEWRIDKINTSTGASDPSFPITSHYSIFSDQALSIALDISGGYMYIAGFDQTPGSTNDEWKIDKRSMSTGAMATNFPVTDDVSTGNDVANSIAVDPSGGYIYVVGYDSGSGHRWRIEKRSTTTGAEATNFPISESVSGTDAANSVAIDTSGGYMYIGGMDSGSANEWRIEKRDLTSGATTSPGFAISENLSSGDDTATSVALDVSGGNLYVAGYDNSPGNAEWRTEQRSMSNGALHSTTESTLAAQNTAVTGSSIGQGTEFHLRYLDNIGNSQLDASGQSFKLQYAQRGVDNLCDTAFSGETYSDVGSSGAFNYYASAVGSDGSAITDDGNVTDGSNTRVAQDLVESNTNFTNNQAAIPSGQDGLWDLSLTDVSASGTTAYCFRIVKSTGSLLDTYTVIPEITTAPPSFNQDSYRWFNTSSTTTAGTTLAAINTIASAPAQGTPVRLRLLVGVASAPLSSSGQSFKLQIATAAGPPGSATCSSSMAYSDVTSTSGAFRYYDNTSITDGVAMVASANDPTATTVNTQNYVESNTSFINGQSSIVVGADGEWDISLVNAAAFANTTYCFRVVTSAGSVLSNYNHLPGITATSTPITDQQLRGGEWFDSSIASGDPDQPFYW